jgi:hypothetical protein
VEPEREKVHAVVAQLNRMLGGQLGFVLEVLDWKTHVAPDMGRPQEVINRQIKDYDIFVGIMWKRFGSDTGVAGSGTAEEFNIAYDHWQKDGKPRILFYFCKRPFMPSTPEEMQQFSQVFAFKEKFKKMGLGRDYERPEQFADSLREHLHKWVFEKFRQSAERTKPIADFTSYVEYLKKETMYIDIRGLVTGEGKVHQFMIDQLYIPLKTTTLDSSGNGSRSRRSKSETLLELTSRTIDLQETLTEKHLVIKGEPGAGKTTFLRLLTFTLCQKWLGEKSPDQAVSILWPELPPLPVYVRIGRLAEFIRHCKENDPGHAPVFNDHPDCLLNYLEAESQEFNWKLEKEDFRRELEAGHGIILLDGLDEAPDETTRQEISSLANELIKAFPQCQVVVTGRPPALVGEAVPANFSMIEIAPLDEPSMESLV